MYNYKFCMPAAPPPFYPANLISLQGDDHHYGGAKLESDAELGVVGAGDWHCSQQPQSG